jgi:hypothetical protein
VGHRACTRQCLRVLVLVGRYPYVGPTYGYSMADDALKDIRLPTPTPASTGCVHRCHGLGQRMGVASVSFECQH